MNYTGRIDGFQIRDVTYIGLPPKSTPPQYDIVKASIGFRILLFCCSFGLG